MSARHHHRCRRRCSGGGAPAAAPLVALVVLLLSWHVAVISAAEGPSRERAPSTGETAAAPPQRARAHHRRGGRAGGPLGGGGGGGEPGGPPRKLQFDAFLARARAEIAPEDEAPGCDARVGMGYVERWRRLGGELCGGGGGGGANGSSAVVCNAHPAADLTACLATNALVDGPAFMGGGSDDGLPAAPRGSVKLACARRAPVDGFLRGRLRNDGPRRFAVDAAADAKDAEVAAACAAPGAVRHAIVLLTRVDGANAFHNAEALVHLFLGLAALRVPPNRLARGLQVLIADNLDAGHQLDALRRLSAPHPLARLKAPPFARGACLRTAVLAPYVGHANSLLAAAAEEVGCRSVALTAAAHWLRELFADVTADARGAPPPLGALPGERAQQLPGVRVAGFVWLARGAFEARRAADGALSDWQKARAAPNEADVIAALQRAVLDWNAKSCIMRGGGGGSGGGGAKGAGRGAANKADGGSSGTGPCRESRVLFAFQALELSALPLFPDQVFELSRAGVLAGVHGAGLTNALWMRPGEGAVLEVVPGAGGDGDGGNGGSSSSADDAPRSYHYVNLAAALGHAYFDARAPGGGAPLPVDAIAAAAAKAMDAAAAAAAKAAQRRQQQRRRRAGFLGMG